MSGVIQGEVNFGVLAAMADDYGPRTFETLHLRNLQIQPEDIEWEFPDDTGSLSGTDESE